MYGSEIWGFQAVKSIELVQVQFCKYFLGVSQQTANMIALGECGRLPLWVKYMSRCIKFWLKLFYGQYYSPKVLFKASKWTENMGGKY